MPLSSDQIADLIDRHYVALQFFLGKRCAGSEDVVQEAFCRLALIDPPPDRPAAWLYRVVRNLAADQLVSSRRRRSRERRAALSESVDDNPSLRLDANEAVNAVRQLDEPLRDVLTARIWGQLRFEEIAEICGISTATASRRYRTALVQLRKQLSASCPTTIR